VKDIVKKPENSKESLSPKYKHAYMLLTRENNAVVLRCQRCGHEWTYNGLNPYVATCTYCCSRVWIKKNKVSVGQASNHGQLTT